MCELQGYVGKSMARRHGWRVLAAILLAGFAIRVYRLGFQSLWYDEAYSFDLARQDIISLTLTTAADIHPPLYYYVLKAWLEAAGTSEFSLRYLSLMLGLLLVPAAFALASLLFGRRVGLVSGALAAGSPLYVYYSQEVRMYALMGLASLLAAYFALRALATGRPMDWGLYVGCTIVALYSHLYSALTFASLNVAFAGAALAGTDRAGPAGSLARLRLRQWVVAQVAVVVLFAPWLVVAAEKYLTYTSPSGGSGIDWIIMQTVFVFSLGHSVYGITTFPGMPWYQDQMNKALLLVAPSVALAALGAWTGLRSELPQPASSLPRWAEIGQRARSLFVVVYLLLPVLLIFLLSAGRRDFNARYLFGATPAYYILIALGLNALGSGRSLAAGPQEADAGAPQAAAPRLVLGIGRVDRPLILALSVLALGGTWGYSLLNYYFVEQYARDDHRSAVAYVQHHIVPGDLVILDANFDQVYRYYAGDKFDWVRFPESVPPDDRQTLVTLATVVPKHRHVWLIEWGDYFLDPKRIVEHWLERNAFLIDSKVFHGPILVYGFLTQPPVLKSGEEPRPSRALRADFAGQALLVGYDQQVIEAGTDRRVHLTLYWLAERKMEVNYSVFGHLLNPAGQMAGLGDSQPVAGRVPTSAWELGRVVQSELDVRVYAGTAPGEYRLVVGLYDQVTMARLPTDGRDWVELDPVRLIARATSLEGLEFEPAHGVQFGEAIELVGHRVARPVPDELRLTLFWRARAKPPRRYTVFNHVIDPSGKLVAQRDSEPNGGHYPTDGWETGEVVRDEYTIRLPPGLNGQYRLLTGLYVPDTGERLPVRWWGLGRGSTFELGQVRLGP